MTRIAALLLLLVTQRAWSADLPTIPDSLAEAYAVNSLGFQRSRQTEVFGALDYFLESLDRKRATRDIAGEAYALNAVGVIYFSLGDSERALPYLQQALTRRRALGDKRHEANALQNLATAQTSIGLIDEALAAHTQALRLMRELGDRKGETYALNSAGRAHLAAGETDQALRNFLAAFELSRTIGDRRLEGHTLNNLGALYESIDELEAAMNYYGQALALKKAIGDRYGEALVLNNLGVVEIARGRTAAARERFSAALPLFQAAGDRYGEAHVLNNIGIADEKERAIDAFRRSLTIRREIGDRRGEALTLFNLAAVQSKLGQDSTSLFEESLAISDDIGDARGQVLALQALGHLARDGGDLALGRQRLLRAVEIVESMRERIQGGELRASFSASRQSIYESYIDLLMQSHRVEPAKGHDAAALQWAEQSRARAFLDALGERAHGIRAGLDPHLVHCQRVLHQQLSAKADRYMRLLGSPGAEGASRRILKDIEQLKAERAAIESEIRARDPRYSELTRPAAPNLANLRRQVIGADTLLLEYALGEDRSYLWAVTADGLASFVLPPRSAIESAARSLYAAINARGERLKFETDDEKRERVRLADAEYVRLAARTSNILLAPVAGHLGTKRLLIVPDGALHYVPFAALPHPQGSRPLVLTHEVAVIPSASVLAARRRDFDGRQAAPKVLAVIADPVFEAGDPRLNRPMTSSTSSFNPKRLPFTREEAISILSLVPPGRRRGLFGFEANRQAMANDTLRDYRIVHFATHAWIDESRPELSALVLSQFDREGRVEDGFVRMSELFNLNLNADLVVLSGCRTALGKPLRGEGLVGLSRGFMYAGARRMVLSLWNVNDRSTAELMKHFYRQMLEKGQQPAAALRRAQIAMMNDARWGSPYYWAAFVLSGDPE